MTSHRADDCVLLNNIDASATATWNARSGYPGTYYGFEPVGAGAAFTGTFDGGGFTISNLYINRTNQNGSPTGWNKGGLLGTVTRSATGGFIKDLNLLNVDITGGTNAAPLAAAVATSGSGAMMVSDVSASGAVKIVWGGAGGLITHAGRTSVFEDCSTSCSITRTGTYVSGCDAGGFVHFASLGATLTDCTASGSINITQTSETSNVSRIGGFVGRVGDVVTFSGCTATGDVTVNINSTSEARIGGFAGEVLGTVTLDECFAYGDVSFLSTTKGVIGGFAGYCTEVITKCGAEGDVENSSKIATAGYNVSGGFAGHLLTGSTTNCYAKGKVCEDGIGHTDANIGGFVGYIASGTIATSYSAGAVYSTGTPTNGGGFTGRDGGGTITNCFYDNESSNWTTSDGAATGKSTVLMKTEETFTDVGWDFDAIWELASYTRSPGTGTTIWLSEVSDYEDFEEGVNDADSFSVTLPTTNSIMWVEALESLIAGTGGDEWKIASNDFGTHITPLNATIRQQTNYGSKAMQALKVNESILFVDFVGRKIRELTYSEEHGKHVAPDLSSLAEHITDSGITSMAHQRNPDSIIWCTLTDGSLVSMTYERDQNVVAWADHPIDGLVQSVCVIPTTSEDEVWITVKRTMTGVNSGVFVIYVERMASRTFTDIEDCFFVDSGKTIEHSSAATTTIAGLSHLEGETVALLGDGVDLDTYTVSSGVITASTAVTTVQVGKAYTSKLEPMKPVVETQMGTSAGSIVKVAEMGISLLDSAGVKYGTSDDALYDIDLSDARWVNLSEIDGLFTGSVVVSIDGGFSLESPLIISSSSPLPVTIRALIPRLEQTGR